MTVGSMQLAPTVPCLAIAAEYRPAVEAIRYNARFLATLSLPPCRPRPTALPTALPTARQTKPSFAPADQRRRRRRRRQTTGSRRWKKHGGSSASGGGLLFIPVRRHELRRHEQRQAHTTAPHRPAPPQPPVGRTPGLETGRPMHCAGRTLPRCCFTSSPPPSRPTAWCSQTGSYKKPNVHRWHHPMSPSAVNVLAHLAGEQSSITDVCVWMLMVNRGVTGRWPPVTESEAVGDR